MNRIQKLFLLIILTIFSYNSFAQTQGERLFIENNPEQAVEILENEIIKGEITTNTYNFLGLGYYQLGLFDKAVNSFERGVKSDSPNRNVLFFNQGNAYYALKNYSAAADCYSKALKEDPLMYPALLNKANSLLMNNKYSEAKEEYISFLQKCPNDPQKENIEEIIKLLNVEIERIEEEQRLLAEADKPQWEQIDDPLIALGVKTDVGHDVQEEWEEINSQPDKLTIDQLDYMASGNGNNEEVENVSQEEINNQEEIRNQEEINNAGNNLSGFGTMVTNNYNTYNENYYNSYGSASGDDGIIYSKNNEKNNIDMEKEENINTLEHEEIDNSLNEKRRQLAEAEEKRKAAQSALDKQLEEHKKLSEEEQQKLNELAELEKKLEEYRKLTEAEQQRLEELAALEKELEAGKNIEEEKKQEELLANQKLKNEEEHNKRLQELAEYEKMLAEQKLALEEEQLKQEAEKKRLAAEQEKLKAEQELLKAQDELNKKVNNSSSSLSEEEMREKIRRELLDAENKRRKQMLDDVANSLQNSSSTNMSSGAEDIIDYKFEGELD